MYRGLVIWILEMIGLGGLVLLLSYIKWVHVVFGGVLTLLGAFFPAVRVPSRASTIKPEAGDVQIKFDRLTVVARGTLRALVVIAGIVVIVGGIVDGFHAREKARKEAERRVATDFLGLHDDKLKKLDELIQRMMQEEAAKTKRVDNQPPDKVTDVSDSDEQRNK